MITVTRRRFSKSQVRSRAAPVTLQGQGSEAAPDGKSAPGPWLNRAPENRRYPADVQVYATAAVPGSRFLAQVLHQALPQVLPFTSDELGVGYGTSSQARFPDTLYHIH